MTEKTDAGEAERYAAGFVKFMEIVWGPGFMSPGGEDEAALVVDGLDLTGLRVLDLGCGLGACSFMLAERLGAESVVGVDIQSAIIRQATEAAERRGLEGKVSFQQIEPGPLPLADGEFDVVFSRDVIAAIPEKEQITQELFRVLKPGGTLAASDWMSGADGPMSPRLKRFADVMTDEGVGLVSPDNYFAVLRAAGFDPIEYRSRTAWFYETATRELADIRGSLHEEILEACGEEMTVFMTDVWEALSEALEFADLCTINWRAIRPEA